MSALGLAAAAGMLQGSIYIYMYRRPLYIYMLQGVLQGMLQGSININIVSACVCVCVCVYGGPDAAAGPSCRAASVRGLKLRVYEALSYECVRP